MSLQVEEVREQLIALLPRLRRFARTLARHTHDADDLVQTAVERALQRLNQWRPGSRLDSWMFGIIRNAWIDEVRARRRRERVLAPAESGENVVAVTDDAEVRLLALQDALAHLPDDQRLAIGLVLVEGLSYREAAQVLEVPIGTLTSRLARGRQALAAMLAGSGGVTR